MPSSPSSSKNWLERLRVGTAVVAATSFVALALPFVASAGVPARFECTCKGSEQATSCPSSGPVDVDVDGMTADAAKSAVDARCQQFCSTLGQIFCEWKTVTLTTEALATGAVKSSSGLQYAQPANKDCPKGTPDGVICVVNPLGEGGEKIPTIIGRILTAFLGVLGSFALMMFVYGGVTWLLSGGSPDKVKKGKDIMVWAILGMALVFASAALVRFVLQAFTSL